ncbi:MAG: hypothetical protein R3Y12_00195 [Clostridia bacterium]
MPIKNYLKRKIIKQQNVPVSQTKLTRFYDENTILQGKSSIESVNFDENNRLITNKAKFAEMNFMDSNLGDVEDFMHNYTENEDSFEQVNSRELTYFNHNLSGILTNNENLAESSNLYNENNMQQAFFSSDVYESDSKIAQSTKKYKSLMDFGTARVVPSSEKIENYSSRNLIENSNLTYETAKKDEKNELKLSYDEIYNYILNELKKEMRN